MAIQHGCPDRVRYLVRMSLPPADMETESVELAVVGFHRDHVDAGSTQVALRGLTDLVPAGAHGGELIEEQRHGRWQSVVCHQLVQTRHVSGEPLLIICKIALDVAHEIDPETHSKQRLVISVFAQPREAAPVGEELLDRLGHWDRIGVVVRVLALTGREKVVLAKLQNCLYLRA